MVSRITYLDFLSDHEFFNKYNKYQEKHASTIRESDKVILGVVDGVLRNARGAGTVCLDIGCSTGNLLLHLKNAFPVLNLTGGDLAQSSIELCRANPALAGIEFRSLNILDLPRDRQFDIVIVNAVLYMLSDEEFALAFSNIAAVLAPNGVVVAFDFFHPFEQDITVFEKSALHPNGLELHFRPMSSVEAILEGAGLSKPGFRPFTLPIDLPPPPDPADITTHTVMAADGRRLPFRGTLFQPWCHMTSSKI